MSDGFGSGTGAFGTGGLGGGSAPIDFGSGTSKLTGTNAPGTISPFERGLVGNVANENAQAMMNRYAQLGLSAQGATPTSPGGAAGGIGAPGVNNMASANPNAMPTAERMDLGTGFPGGLPSITGGITGEAEALLGQIQNLELQQPGGGGGGGGGKGGGMGGIGSMLGPMMMMGGK